MVQCPKCSTNLDADFGMVTCPNCTSMVFIEFDGSAKIADSVETDLAAPDMSSFDSAMADSVFQIESNEPLQERVTPVTDEPVSPDDPLGVTAYANSEFSHGKDGLFLFNLFIDGLDSKEIRESLREAMNDSRFSFDANQLLGQIRGGKLLIKNVSPVQASILVNRLKRLPLSISWEQNAITTIEKF